ncbi:undecaprenyldiphospho-muramoylpentapeptide beta-N-acetylglucosaminyltransferase [Spizellomyces sp. 'palustris']|nr:undecaprenyldiphospho-muramoylpentapeptide beta-N-acetylglucosaminyltransferase [Spizellomyces sp. 'palustris']
MVMMNIQDSRIDEGEKVTSESNHFPLTVVGKEEGRTSTSTTDIETARIQQDSEKKKNKSRLRKLLRIRPNSDIFPKPYPGPSSAPAVLDVLDLAVVNVPSVDEGVLSSSPPRTKYADEKAKTGLWKKLQRRNTTPVKLIDRSSEQTEHWASILVKDEQPQQPKCFPDASDQCPQFSTPSLPSKDNRVVRFVDSFSDTDEWVADAELDSESDPNSLGSGDDSGNSDCKRRTKKKTKRKTKPRGKSRRLAKKLSHQFADMFSWFGGRGPAGAGTSSEAEAVNNPVLHLVTAALKVENDPDLTPASGDHIGSDHLADDRSSIHSLFLEATDALAEPENTPDTDGDIFSQSSGESDGEDRSPALTPAGQSTANFTIAEKLQIAFELPEPEPYRVIYAFMRVCLENMDQFNTPASSENEQRHHEKALQLIGRVNLKNVVDVQKSKQHQRGFSIVTRDKKYRFKADTETAREEWMKALKASMVRARNEGDDVRIVLPFANITELELSGSSSVTDSLRIKVVDDESALAEEYFFAYFNNLPYAYSTLIDLWQPQRSSPTRPTNPRRKSMYDTTATSVLPLKPADVSSRSGLPTPTGSMALLPPAAETLSNSHHRRTQSEHPHSGSPTSESDSPRQRISEDGDVTDSSSHPSRSSMSSTSASELGQSGGEGPSRPASGWRRKLGHRKTRSDAGVLRDMGVVSGIGGSQQSQPTQKQQQHKEIKADEFRKTFALPDSEQLIASYHCSLHRTVPRLGKLYISSNHLCFKSKRVGIRTRLLVPLIDIVDVLEAPGFGWRLRIATRAGDVFLCEFHSSDVRSRCLEVLGRCLREMDYADTKGVERALSPLRHQASILDDIERSDSHIRPSELYNPPVPAALHITLLTIGTRGDVQPYIALGLRLQTDGHTVRIATHSEYKDWIEGFGIEFREVKGNPAELMRLCVENGMFTVGFLREAVSKFRGWVDELLLSAYEACKDTNLLIESPTAMAGLHIAEHLQIPYFAAFPMPWTRTRYYPHPFAVPDRKRKGLGGLGGSYNWMTHVMIEGLLWRGVSGQVNRFRRKTLRRPPIQLGTLNDHKIPFLYSFSPTVVPPPPDWQDWIHTTGYWFLDDSDPDWTPPEDLQQFLEESKGKPVVYIGFGSIVVSDPDEMTRTIISAVLKSNVRAILSKGWSGRLATSTPSEPIAYPPQIYPLTKPAPHSFLFPLCTAAIHHGGAGTTAATLRAGIPMSIHPFFGDQFFWADRISDLGVGVTLRKLSVNKLSAALETLVTDTKMQQRARVVGERLKREDGVGEAIRCIYRDLDFAQERIKHVKTWVDERWGGSTLWSGDKKDKETDIAETERRATESG